VNRQIGSCVPLWVLSLVLVVSSACAGETSSEREQTRAIMKEIFQSIRVVLPLTADEARFQAPENRPLVHAALASLSGNAVILAAHARRDDAARRFFGESLARDAGDALDRYDAGRYDSARFLIQQATENCVACHTRLPSPGDSPVAADFVAQSALVGLPLDERARLQVATRQFGDALTSLETLLASPDLHAAEMLSPLGDYLIVAVRVKGEPERAIPTLEKFSRRPDLWRHLQLDVEQWIASLRKLEPALRKSPDLDTARGILEDSKQLTQFPADRRAFADYVVASSVLNRFIESGNGSPQQVAEAYYLLGVCESRIDDTYWVSPSDRYLETAIRMAPRAPFAKEAYALLEEEVILDYTGSAGTQLPPSMARRLAELRALVEAQ
jgi:hypothetical protein